MGDDNVNGSGGDDLFIWNDGDNSDQVIGGAGTDSLRLSGSEDDAVGDEISISANGTETRVDRTSADTFTLDLGGIESIAVDTRNGNDQLTVNNLNGVTDLASLDLNGGIGNDRIDASALPGGTLTTVTLNGGDGNDTLTGHAANDTINGDAGFDTIVETGNVDFILMDTQLTGLGTDMLSGIESADLTGGGGVNTLDASAFTLAGVTLNGAGNDDILIGTNKNDTLNGSDGNDTLTGNAGNDVINGDAGIDTVVETGDIDFVLTNELLTGLGNDRLSGVEGANLTGGESINTLDASVFTLGNVTLNGAGNNDTLIGGTQNDTLNGGEGNDILTGNAGDDTINGDAGSDSLVEAADVDFVLTDIQLTGLGADTVSGLESGNLTGGASSNTIDTSAFTAGNVILSGGDNDDTLIAGSGNDALNGGDGNDSLTGNAGDDTINGDAGTDTIQEAGDVNFVLNDTQLTGLGTDLLSQIESANLTGGNSSNTLDASAFTLGNVTLSGVDNDDTLIGSTANDTLNGGNGNDTLTGNAGDDTINGDAGIDTIQETGDVNFALSDTQLTGLGTDLLSQIESASLTGGNSANTLDASAFTLGNVTLSGADNDDTLIGGTGDDTLNGGGGNDILTGNSGGDTINGNEGTDTLIEAADVNFLLTDTQLTGLGTDTLSGLETVNLTGGAGANNLDASAFMIGDVILSGDDGNDRLIGTRGNDTLNGGEGNDILTGGSGNDTLNGDAGTDFLVESGDVDIVLTDIRLTGLGTDTHSGIEDVSLTGGPSGNTLDTSAFTFGDVVLNGAGGTDTLIGGSGNDTLNGGDDNDTLTGNAGDDTINGDAGTDTMVETGDVNFVLNDTQLTGLGTDGLSEIELALLTGGDSINTLDASAFTLGSVTLSGADNNDILVGGTANDTLSGGAGSDSLVGGPGNDEIFGDEGDDLMVWNDGDGDDPTIDGGSGTDTLQVNGSLDGATGDTFTISSNGTQSQIERTNLNTFSINTELVETLEVNSREGNDMIMVDNLNPVFETTLKLTGGPGNDTVKVNGSNNDGNDLKIGTVGEQIQIEKSIPTKYVAELAAIENIEVDARQGTNNINVESSLSLPGTLELAAENITFSDSDIEISASTFSLPNEATTVKADGNITFSAPITAPGTLDIESNGGDITTATVATKPGITNSITIVNPNSREPNGGDLKGKLKINSNGGDITLGDVSISSAIDINAQQGAITLVRRSNGNISVFNNTQPLSNRGLTIAATDTIDISAGRIQLAGAGRAPVLITQDGGGINQSIQNGPGLTSGSPFAVAADVGRQIAAAVPKQNVDVPQEVSIGTAEKEKLRQLGIYSRDLTDEETITSSSGRSTFYRDIPYKENELTAGPIAMDPKPWDHKVAPGRIPADVAAKALNTYYSIFFKQVIDEQTGIQKIDEDGNPVYENITDEIKEKLQLALNACKAKLDMKKIDGEVFRKFADSSADHTEVRNLIDKLQILFHEIELLGLTPPEFEISKRVLLRKLKLRGMRTNQLKKAIETITGRDLAMHPAENK